MNPVTQVIAKPLSRSLIVRCTAAARRVQPAAVQAAAVASPFSSIVRVAATALTVLTLLTSVTAQSVGDFIIEEKTSSAGRVTKRYWPKGPSTLWGANSSSLPAKIAIGSGLSLSGSPLTLSSSFSGSIADVTGLQAALDGKASTIHNQSWSTITGTPTTLAGYGITSISVDAFKLNTAVDSLGAEELGLGWVDSRLTLQGGGSVLQWYEDGGENIMAWAGKMQAESMDLTHVSLFTAAPATLSSSGEAGQMAYDDTGLYVCTALNTWRLIPWTQTTSATPSWLALTNDQVNNNATANTLANITGLEITVVPGTYWFRIVCHYHSAITTTGSRWTINGPTTSALSYHSRYSLAATTQTTNDGLAAYNLPAACNLTSIVTGNMATIEGIATFTAGGAFVPRFASEISNSAITVKAGSKIEYLRLY